MTDLATTLHFIQTIEQQNPGSGAYEIANRLRGYTKPSYTTQAWTIATGTEQSFIDGTLNLDLTLAGEVLDFGHFIASLSDQINQPGLQWSDLTRWTGDHTAWAGDVGSAIATYRAQPNKFKNLEESLNRFASSSDYTADVAACVLGAIVNANPNLSISQAIAEYHAKPYSEHVRSFLETRFNVIDLTNPAKLEADIRNAVFAYLELSPDTGFLKSLKKLFSQKLRVEGSDRGYLSADLLQGSLHFMRHLIQKGNFGSVKFKPYQQPQAPWLGTVNYEVSV
jgi:hypothetical protein